MKVRKVFRLKPEVCPNKTVRISIKITAEIINAAAPITCGKMRGTENALERNFIRFLFV
jgi:hypothetical protein